MSFFDSFSSGLGSDDDDDVYFPDPMGRVGQGTWKKRDTLSDPFGRVPSGRKKKPEPELSNLGDPFKLAKPVGLDGANDRKDVAKVETLLGKSGHLDTRKTDGPTGYFGGRVENAIKGFQKDRGLKVDGKLNPGGQTISALDKLFGKQGRVIKRPAFDPPKNNDNYQVQLMPQEDSSEYEGHQPRPAVVRNGYVWDKDHWRPAKPGEEPSHGVRLLSAEGGAFAAPSASTGTAPSAGADGPSPAPSPKAPSSGFSTDGDKVDLRAVRGRDAAASAALAARIGDMIKNDRKAFSNLHPELQAFYNAYATIHGGVPEAVPSLTEMEDVLRPGEKAPQASGSEDDALKAGWNAAADPYVAKALLRGAANAGPDMMDGINLALNSDAISDASKAARGWIEKKTSIPSAYKDSSKLKVAETVGNVAAGLAAGGGAGKLVGLAGKAAKGSKALKTAANVATQAVGSGGSMNVKLRSEGASAEKARAGGVASAGTSAAIPAGIAKASTALARAAFAKAGIDLATVTPQMVKVAANEIAAYLMQKGADAGISEWFGSPKPTDQSSQ